MPTSPSHHRPASAGESSLPAAFWLLAFAFAAVNLRAPIVVIGPILEPIMDTLAIGASTASLFTAAMIVCFGVLSPLAPGLAARLGLDRALALVLALIALGGVLRGVEMLPVMIVGTLLVGAGIACGNVFMPSLVKRDRPDRIGATMGIYTVTLGIGSTLAAGTAVPLMHLAGNWSVPIWLWAGVALVTAIGWAVIARRHSPTGGAVNKSRITALFKNPVAWTLTVFMGMQSLEYYTLQTWIAKVANDAGVPDATAGGMLSLVNLTTIPASYAIARIAAKLKRHSALAVGLTGIVAIAVIGLWLAPTFSPLLWSVMLGIGQGGCFSLALTMIVLRTREPHHAAMLSGMSQSIGYLVAASGPLIFGALQGMTGNWHASLAFLLILLVAQGGAGYLIGRPRMVEP
ncbi:CynX/NimT family MFS transporter [Phytohalomonas tamaricis]|uniref:CynX/NimT family MFS transporter n=1 Tax=Phytohalomonas tamaricis TaxID=2081032 RepID=UPI000D0B9940|nr:MFS transporter [Phytohalomonas tamaricis]